MLQSLDIAQVANVDGALKVDASTGPVSDASTPNIDVSAEVA